MGRLQVTLRWGSVARVAAVAVGCLALAHCSGPFGKESRYSKRVIEDGEPVPKGGGTYRVGRPYSINGRTYVPTENPNYRIEGVASWYGPDFHGRLTANGEVYDMYSISAAHTTMPLPSYARITNLDNGRSIIVRVNDRGPYARERVIDLSIGAAKVLHFYSRGLARVRVEYVGRAPLEGSDDDMLLATLREGSPAPAPSKVMVAAAKPFLPDAENSAPLGRTPARGATPAPAGEATPPSRTSRSSAPTAEVSTGAAASVSPAGPTTGFAPLQTGAPALGLMSGRGLY
jgi:rare lipoprotein A